MKSIFRIIFLRFLVMLVLSFIGTFITRRIITGSLFGGETIAIATVDSELNRALELFRSGGPRVLATYLDRLGRSRRADFHVMDRSGRDLVDGTDRSSLLRHSPGFQIPFLGRTSNTRVITLDDRSFFMSIASSGQFNFKEFFSYYGWTFASILALSWWLAIDLGSPLRKLRLAVQEFGRGNLKARTHSTRKDEVGELAAAFDQMADRIQNLVYAERRLLQDISHELRSPLTRLTCAIEIARNRGDSDGAIARIHKECERLNNLVNELLEVAAAEGDPSATPRERVGLNHLVTTLLDDCGIEADRKQCHLTFSADADVDVRGDFELLRRAIENILRNAMRYAPSGTSVETQLSSTDRSVLLTIRDYGKGVPPEFLTDIFKPFFRVESHRGQEGVGLGLALAQRDIRLHQGTVSASNASPGLLVTIQLPLDMPSLKHDTAISR